MLVTTTKPAEGSNLRPTPPAGTKTHKQGCACPICKAQRKKAEQDVRAEEYTLAIRTKKAEEIAKVENLESQIGRVQEALRGTEDKLSIAQVQPRNAQDNNKLLEAEVKHLTSERDGYAADLKVITAEANLQRKAADEAKAALKQERANNETLQLSLSEERRDSIEETQKLRESLDIASLGNTFQCWLVGVVMALVSGVAFYFVGRLGR